MNAPKELPIVISAPDFGTATVLIRGTAPLVIERFANKAPLMMKMAEGGSAKNKKVREARDYERDAEKARYRSLDGWEGFNAAAIRCAAISACRLVGFKMTLAKLSLQVIADGHDADGTPLIRVFGPSQTFTAHTRNATGVVDIRARPMYPKWAARLRVQYDQTQFRTVDVINLLSRAGLQVGIGAGRPDSKSSAGCGWGTFEVVPGDQMDDVVREFGVSF